LGASEIHKRFPNAVIKNPYNGDLTVFHDGKMYRIRKGIVVWRKNQICDYADWEDTTDEEVMKTVRLAADLQNNKFQRQLRPEWKNPVEIVTYTLPSPHHYFYLNATSGLRADFDEKMQVWVETKPEIFTPIEVTNHC